VRAFEVNALDYLLKPIEPDRLAAAIQRYSARSDAVAAEEDDAAPSAEFRQDDCVFVRDGGRCWVVDLQTLYLLEAEGNYTRLFFGAERPLLHRSLSSLESRLPPALFFRANRSQIINLKFIASAEPWFSGGIKVTLRGGLEVELSRREAQVFRSQRGL
jgi:two-component system LytT family response regulator